MNHTLRGVRRWYLGGLITLCESLGGSSPPPASMETTYLYVLMDNEYQIRYIGKSNNPDKRFKKHLSESKKSRTHKEKWINSLLSNNSRPIMAILDVVSISEWGFWEEFWISQLKSWGFKLTNATNGGEGGDGFRGKSHTKETKEICRNSSYKRKTKTILSGEDNGRCKLSTDDIISIKELVSLGVSKKDIAEKFNINKKYIYQILSGKRRLVK